MESKFYKPTGFVSCIFVSLRNSLNKTVKVTFILTLHLLGYFSVFSQGTSLSFSQISSDFARPGAGAEVWIGQYTMNLPGKLDLYWRFHWASDFQPGNSSRTTYDWSAFDNAIHSAINNNQKFSFDIMERCGACGTDSKPIVGGAGLVYPQWLHNAMQSESVKDWVSGGNWVPNWNSSNYINGWKELNQAVYNHIMNTSYNGVPYKNVIRYIGAGGYGDYGEWTNNYFNGPSGSTATPATLKSIIDGTVQSYPTFQIVALEATYDGNLLPNTQIPPEVGYYALTTSNAYGKLGYRRESWGDPTWFNDAWSIGNTTVYNGLNFAQAISNIYKYAPVVGEPLDLGVTNHYSDILREFQAMHVNSCGNGNFDGEQNNSTAVANFAAAIKASGYNITLTGGNINGNAVSLNWQNSGLTPTYEDWDATFELRNGNTVIYSQKSSFKLRLFLGTNAVTDNLTGNGTGDLYLIIRDPNGYRKPLPLAISGRNADGSYLLKTNVTIGGATPPANKPPVSNAGSDQSITLPASSVTLNGSGSSDPDGTISSYLWTKISGPSQLTIAGATSASTGVSNLAAGVYSFQLKVTDNGGAIALDTIKVIVNAAAVNQAPVANAGADIAITLPANSVNLNGSASHDADGTIAAYAWSEVSGPSTASLTAPANAATAVGGLQQGVYVFSLKVTDNNGASSTDVVNITVNAAANMAPVANAGTGQAITLPTSSVTLDGSLSSDADGTISSYAWTQVSGPSTSTISGGSISKPTASGLVAGLYTFQLVVTDNKGATGTSSVKITVINSVGVQPPVANAGADKSITLPTNTTVIDGSASSASSATIASYVWAEKSGPSTVSLSNTAKNTISNLQAGVYVFVLTVTDSKGATAMDSVRITVIPVVNRAPVADAGASVSLVLPKNSTSLDGSKSSDPDGVISSYQWTRISGPNMPATVGAGAAVVSLGGLVAGTYTYQLTVTDNNGASSSGQVKIIVAAAANLPPVANAGANQSITSPASSVNLNGSASGDADGKIVSYNWITVSGPGAITINNSNTVNPSVVGLQPGGYVFELTVTDNQGATAKDQVSVTVLPKSLSPNQAPVANAGNNQTITAPLSSVSLSGSSSFDPDGTISGYSWKQISGPSASGITGGNTGTPVISGLIVGQYIFELTVTDNNGVKNTDQVSVTVNAASGKVNLPPVASAGTSDTVELPNNSYTLSAMGSKDPDGTIGSYQWQQISGPNTVKSSNMNVPQVAISDFEVGEYEFQVVVTDNEGATSTAMMKLTVEPSNGLTDRFIVYPNPAHDVTTAKITSSVTGKVKIVVYDMNGRLVLTTEAEKRDDVVTKTLNVSPLASGMYTVQIVIGNKKTMVTKFVKN